MNRLVTVVVVLILAASCSGGDDPPAPDSTSGSEVGDPGLDAENGETEPLALTGDDQALAQALELDPTRADVRQDVIALEASSVEDFESAASGLGFVTLIVREDGEWLPIDSDAPRTDRVNVSTNGGTVDRVIGIR